MKLAQSVVCIGVVVLGWASNPAEGAVKLGVGVVNAGGNRGAKVEKIVEGGLAENMTIEVGDVIRYIRSDNNRFSWRIANANQLVAVLRSTNEQIVVTWAKHDSGRLYRCKMKVRGGIIDTDLKVEELESDPETEGDEIRTPEMEEID